MNTKEFTQGPRCIFVSSHGSQRLRYQQGDLRLVSMGLCQGLLRQFQRLVKAPVVVIRLGKRPTRLPRANSIQLQ